MGPRVLSCRHVFAAALCLMAALCSASAKPGLPSVCARGGCPADHAMIQMRVAKGLEWQEAGDATTPSTTTTTTLRRQTCFIWGNLHVMTFDSTAEAMAGRDATLTGLWAMNPQRIISLTERRRDNFCGLRWLVRSDEIKIQGDYSEHGWLDKLAVSGSFLQGHTLIFSADGSVKWDGAVIVSTFPATFNNELMRLRYFKSNVFQSSTNIARQQWPRTESGYELKTMHVDLPQQVMLTVNVGELFGRHNFLDAFFTLGPFAGLDGLCGKADGDISSDDQQYLVKRISQFRVSRAQSLLGNMSSLASEEEETSVAEDEFQSECLNGTRAEAQSLCQSTLPEDTPVAWVDACAVDVCFGGPEMANHTLAVLVQEVPIVGALTEEEKKWEWERGLRDICPGDRGCATCQVRWGCFDVVAWAMQDGILAGLFSDDTLFPKLDADSCFEEVQRALHIWQQDPDLAARLNIQDTCIPLPCYPTEAAHEKEGLAFCR